MDKDDYFYHRRYDSLLGLRDRLVGELEDRGLDETSIKFIIHDALKMMAANIPYKFVRDYFSDKKIEDRHCLLFDPTESEVASRRKMLYAKYLSVYINNINGNVMRNGFSLLFFGYNSSGKTFAALTVLARALQEGRTGYYINMKELYNLYNSYQYRRDEEDSLLCQHIMDVDFLVIDEVGKETGGDENIITTFEQIIKSRTERLLPTIMVTNLDLSVQPGTEEYLTKGLADYNGNEFWKRYGESVWQAMLEHYYIFWLSSKGDGRRKNRLSWEALNEN